MLLHVSTMSFLSASPLPCYVDGKAFIGSNTYDVADPHSPAKVMHSVSSVSSEDVVQVIAAAANAFPAWKAVSHVPARGERERGSGEEEQENAS